MERTEQQVNKLQQLPLLSVKQEVQDIPRLQTYTKDTVIFNAIQNDIPMNLAATNSNEESNKLSLVARQTDSIPDNSNGIVSTQQPSLTIVKEEISSDDYSNIPVFCKKVRQAQQAKGLWSGPITNTNPTININQQSVITSNYSNCSNISRSLADIGGMTNETPKVASLNSLQIRAKKIRLEREQLQLDDANSSEKDSTLPENLGLPRERVISICNMDKKELDDYLNVTEESEDQDPELLQYFQAGESDNKTSTNIGNVTNANAINDVNKININNGKFENKPVMSVGNAEQINQLRYYLHQNLTENKNNLGCGQNIQRGFSSSENPISTGEFIFLTSTPISQYLAFNSSQLLI